MIIAACLDLGTTNIKGSLLDRDLNLVQKQSKPAPPIIGNGVIQESCAQQYQNIVENILTRLFHDIDRNIPIGIASQRSSFVLWRKNTGKPVSPLISWQDRRALPWCKKNETKRSLLTRDTGLPFSPHYAGPKLAFFLEQNPAIRKDFEKNEILFGTIETFLLWQWTKGKTYLTDLTMASRTMMVNIMSRCWDLEKLKLFGIDPRSIPTISMSNNLDIALENGTKVTAIIGDQPAALCAIGVEYGNSVLVNIGTGGFVTLPKGKKCVFKDGYLTAPYILPNSEYMYCLEGTINGLTLSRNLLKKTYVDFKGSKVRNNEFCIPDSNGIGSPHWHPDLSFLQSQYYHTLSDKDKMSVFLEGIIFRVREIIEDMENISGNKIILSGGAAQNIFLSQGLASCLHREVILLDERENTLLGAGLLASKSGFNPLSSSRIKIFCPDAKGAYLNKKYKFWKEWVVREVSQNQCHRTFSA